ncbi:CPBP family intramembrane glutamic endopeptidase [Propionicimonas sp.]|uniref:CPBP family intramembrane glutamic endopeptidase n=1 Tax=Propionicimonas sp. TaxID=1955623 RepID=UPI0017B635BD|nr:CPBP family intramembrane glutamic endopeptidase [Propionicimonas sp.]MBU3975961.1 CPBP family intramembrane metalloprotease [Actinomycetota bacterium]MBA3020776.1 CPBP family intramembrane metalloprotease [Propionicimonas sp.]MBU3985151.1 CPBP family intramembrane metalloprotease [Actinomycetota bacterium]MBU4008141.1 CPBP family intramembrane metalloprotease [Actinomycetota bacterium]MBU4064645.1 CPBP family intramembrane metalloprotease [Actinomycetota bacterium]
MVSEPGLNAPQSEPSPEPTPELTAEVSAPPPPVAGGAVADWSTSVWPPPPPAVGTEPWTEPPWGAPPPGVQPPPGYVQPYWGTPGMAPLPVVPAKAEPLPVEPREYQQFYRAPAFRWWKPLLAIPLYMVTVALVAIVVVIALIIVVLASGQQLPTSETDYPPEVMFTLNNVLIALGMPLAMLISWWVYRQRPRWLSSISGGFRWRIFWPFLGIAGVGIALATVAQAQLSGGFGELTWTSTSLALILVIVFTTPFQCAAEEYAMRGLLFRSVGSWFGNRWVGLVVAIVVNSVAFMFLHGAGDPWLNAFYVVVGVTFSILTWRTGGLEAAVAMHIANNVISEALLPFQPDSLAHIFDRQAGVAGPEVLIQIGVTALVAGLLLWQSSRLGLRRATAPVAAK